MKGRPVLGLGLGLGLAAGLCACGAAPEPAAPFPLDNVVANRLAALRTESQARGVLDAPPLSADESEEIEGLTSMLAGTRGRMREVALESIRTIGPRAVPALTGILLDSGRTPEVRTSSAELLGALTDPSAAEGLMSVAESAPEEWLRRHALYHLGPVSDELLPRLLLRLKYETDHETFVWIAVALARRENFAGVAALVDLTRTAEDDALRATAAAELERIAVEAGHTSGAALHEAWAGGRGSSPPDRSPRVRSPELRAEVWRLIASTGADQFQLRPVDDARFALARLGPWVVPELTSALHEADIHVRLSVAQVLERMGPRARTAGAELVRALAEPGVAPAAALALGRVDYEEGHEALGRLAGSASTTHELRVAAVRALGHSARPRFAPLLGALHAEARAPGDLRMAAACAALALDGATAGLYEWLKTELTGQVDPAAAEAALGAWLARAGERSALAAEWNALDVRAGAIPSLAEARERRRARAALLKAHTF